MKSYIYTIEDSDFGIPLTIEAELVDWQTPDKLPDIVINDISYKDSPLALWCLTERYIQHLQNRVFQTWCFNA